MAENKPLLELSTLQPKRLSVTIDGKAYALADINAMSINRQAEVLAAVSSFQELAVKGKDINTAEAQQLLDKAVETIGLMVDAPPEIIRGLSLFQDMQIVKVFTDRAGLAPLAQADQPSEQDQPTGEGLSPRSNDSTAGIPAGG